MHPAEYRRLIKASGLPRTPEGDSLVPSTPVKARAQAPRGPPEPEETSCSAFALLPPKAAAVESGLSLAAFWRQVRDGRLPAPLYPSPRSPRWVRAELREALLQTRCRPGDRPTARIRGRALVKDRRLAAERLAAEKIQAAE
jgi:predicted DNA-binding transcriptional regulator AlpA